MAGEASRVVEGGVRSEEVREPDSSRVEASTSLVVVGAAERRSDSVAVMESTEVLSVGRLEGRIEAEASRLIGGEREKEACERRDEVSCEDERRELSRDLPGCSESYESKRRNNIISS